MEYIIKEYPEGDEYEAGWWITKKRYIPKGWKTHDRLHGPYEKKEDAERDLQIIEIENS